MREPGEVGGGREGGREENGKPAVMKVMTQCLSYQKALGGRGSREWRL